MLQRQKALAKKLQLDKVNANNKLKRTMVADISPSIVPPAAVSVYESIPISRAAIPLFAIGDLISIIPDTSQRGYKCNRIQGIVCALNR